MIINRKIVLWILYPFLFGIALRNYYNAILFHNPFLFYAQTFMIVVYAVSNILINQDYQKIVQNERYQQLLEEAKKP